MRKNQKTEKEKSMRKNKKCSKGEKNNIIKSKIQLNSVAKTVNDI